jgi:raffinose/stachyose/melibiose transport system permease protein
MSTQSRTTTRPGEPGPGVGPSGEARGADRAKVRSGPRESLRQRSGLTILLGPALVLFVGFVLVPIAVAVYYSIYKWNGFGPLKDVVGFGNYRRALTDTVFLHSIIHNVIIAGLSLLIQLPLSIGIALLLNRKIRGRTFLRLVVFAPYVLSSAVTAVMWSLMLQPGGFIDHLSKAVGIGAHTWLADIHIVLYTIFVVASWQYMGFGIVLLLAGLQGIPSELREAAALDGATAWQTTRMVILPLLGPTIRIWIFLSMIGSLQLFDLPWIMTGGGPANASSTMSTYLIDKGFHSYEFGYGSAVAVILFVICFVFALLYQRFALRRDTQGALTRMVR